MKAPSGGAPAAALAFFFFRSQPSWGGETTKKSDRGAVMCVSRYKI